MRSICLALAALLLAFPGKAQDGPVADLPMTLLAQRVPMIKVSVNGRKDLNFIPDTGASDEIIDAHLARQLGLPIIKPTPVREPGGTIEIGKTPGADVTLDRASLTKWPFIAAPLKPLEPLLGRPFHGIFGQRFFDRYTVEFDYQRARIRLYESTRYTYKGKGAILRIERPDGRLFVRVGLKGLNGVATEALLQLDTGSFEALGLEGPDVARTRLVGENDARAPLFGVAIGGETSGYRARLSQLTLGPFTIDRPVASVTTSANAGDDPQSMGVLGGGVLNRFRVIVNATRGELILEPNDAFGSAMDHWDASGLILVAPEPFSRIFVHEVLRDSPAARAGLMAGDELLAISGQTVGAIGLDGFSRLLGAPGQVFNLRFRRGSAERDTTITTERLI